MGGFYDKFDRFFKNFLVKLMVKGFCFDKEITLNAFFDKN
jgi:hypothetical protein